MYQITNYDTSATIGYTEQPRYIKLSSSGVYVETDEENAQGVAYKSIPYNLADREGLGLDTTVILFYYDTGDVVINQDKLSTASEDVDALLIDYEYRITLLELGLEE